MGFVSEVSSYCLDFHISAFSAQLVYFINFLFGIEIDLMCPRNKKIPINKQPFVGVKSHLEAICETQSFQYNFMFKNCLNI